MHVAPDDKLHSLDLAHYFLLLLHTKYLLGTYLLWHMRAQSVSSK